MSAEGVAPSVVNGWSLFAHPLICDQIERLIAQVEELRRRDPEGYRSKNATKRLAAVAKLIFDVVPSDPTRAEYRQGSTLGPANTHWFRAKFFGQYRLFFRYHLASKIIVFAWLNDEKTLREYDSKDDAYLVFRKMLERGKPPTDWDRLLREAQAPDSLKRLRRILSARPAG